MLTIASYFPAGFSAKTIQIADLPLYCQDYDDPAANIVVMGDMNAVPGERVVRRSLGSVSSPFDFVYTPHWEHYRAGRGSYNFRGRWYLYDWMLVSPSIARGGRGAGLKLADADIYAKEYMTGPASSAAQGVRQPLRTFYGGDQYILYWKVVARGFDKAAPCYPRPNPPLGGGLCRDKSLRFRVDSHRKITL